MARRTPDARAGAGTRERRWRSSGTPPIASSRSRAPGTRTRRGRRSGCRCRRGRRRSAPPSRGCWCRTTRARSRRRSGSRTSTRRCSGRSTGSSPATLVAIAATGLYLIRSNRRLFAQLAALSDERRELAQQLIATRESTLREISRELHDEFGQVLTAMGSMLGRAGAAGAGGIAAAGRTARDRRDRAGGARQRARPVADAAPVDPRGARAREHDRLVSCRPSRSSSVSRSTYERAGHAGCTSTSTTGIHVYRVLQEALSNVARHSGVETRAGPAALQPTARSSSKSRITGAGSPSSPSRRGLGLVGDARARRAARRHARVPHARATAARWCGCACRLERPRAGSGIRTDSREITRPARRRSRLVRRGFRRMLEDDPAIDVVGEASNGDEAIRLAPTLKPQVVVMDCAMPGTSGLAATRRDPGAAPDVGDPDAQHALRGDAGAAGAGRRRARLHPEERARPRSGRRRQARRGRRDGARSRLSRRLAAQAASAARPDAARARSAAADLRRAVEPRDRRTARPERQHRRGASRQHHERARRPQDRRARGLRASSTDW